MPEGRISTILNQLENLPLVLTSETQHKRMQGLVDQVVIFNELLTSTNTPDVSLPKSGVEDGIQYDQPAYVIFTSGSTGKLLTRTIFYVPKSAQAACSLSRLCDMPPRILRIKTCGNRPNLYAGSS